jgi:hypothetical protein
MALTYADIEDEFDYSLGYVRQDIAWLRQHNSGLNYTVGLLIGCGCEMLAAGGGDKKRRGENVFAELLPPGDWRLLAERLYTALRDGLAHGFDTKHLDVDGQTIQIYISWSNTEIIQIQRVPKALGLYIGVQPLAQALCTKIDEFERTLKIDEAARERFKAASKYQRLATLDKNEAEAWRRLVKAAGY